MIRLSRNDRSVLATWWFTVDRGLLAAILLLAGVGLLLSLAASPAIALRKGYHAFYFVERQVFFLGAALVAMLAISACGPRTIRRVALVLFLAMVAAMGGVLLAGDEVNGARRWLRVAGFSLQPSEFAKPAFVILAAWGLAQARVRSDMPGLGIAVAAYLALVALLAQQPDVGQTLLVTLVWGAMLVMAGQPLAMAAAVAGAGAVGLLTAYLMLPYVRLRFDRFWNPMAGDNSQSDRALQSFIEGGFFGRGPGEGTIKSVLPDAHTDFIFAVVAEEYGVIACLGLIVLFGFIVLRVFARSLDEPDDFRRLAVTGLALVFGLQALINMAVNAGLVPPKGMTLPLISAGGSSTVAVGLGLGMILALTRRRADVARYAQPPFRPTPDTYMTPAEQQGASIR
jgi:cell division protein FtsW